MMAASGVVTFSLSVEPTLTVVPDQDGQRRLADQHQRPGHVHGHRASRQRRLARRNWPRCQRLHGDRRVRPVVECHLQYGYAHHLRRLLGRRHDRHRQHRARQLPNRRVHVQRFRAGCGRHDHGRPARGRSRFCRKATCRSRALSTSARAATACSELLTSNWRVRAAATAAWSGSSLDQGDAAAGGPANSGGTWASGCGSGGGSGGGFGGRGGRAESNPSGGLAPIASAGRGVCESGRRYSRRQWRRYRKFRF